MIVYDKPTYKCEHCKKIYQVKSACEKHEISCSKNPDNNRICFGCVHLCRKKYEQEEPYPFPSREFNLFFCEKLDHFLYPPKVEHKGNFIETGNYNEPMRKECAFFQKPKNLEEFYEHLRKLNNTDNHEQ